MATPDKQEATRSVLDNLNGWGKSSFAPVGLATLLTALHTKPVFARLPMLLFTPMLLFSSYLNVAGYKIDSAGLTAAWSGLYVLLAARRRGIPLRQKFTARGATRGVAMGIGAMNAVAGGWVYATGNREVEKEERTERDRWGIEHAREQAGK